MWHASMMRNDVCGGGRYMLVCDMSASCASMCPYRVSIMWTHEDGQLVTGEDNE